MCELNKAKAHNALLAVSVGYILFSFLSAYVNYDGKINEANAFLLIYWVVIIALFIHFLNYWTARRVSQSIKRAEIGNSKIVSAIGYLAIFISFLYAYRTVDIIVAAMFLDEGGDLRNALLFGEAALDDPILSRLMPFTRSVALYLMILFAAYGNKKYFFIFGLAFLLCEVSVLSRTGAISIAFGILIYYYVAGYKPSKLLYPTLAIYALAVIIGYAQNRLPADASFLQIILDPIIVRTNYAAYTFALGSDQAVQMALANLPPHSSLGGWPYLMLSDKIAMTNYSPQWSDFALYGFPLEVNGRWVYANYTHSTPLILFINSGIIAYAVSILLTILFVAYSMKFFGQSVAIVATFFCLYRASITPQYIGFEFFVCMPIVFFVAYHMRKRKQSQGIHSPLERS